MQNARGVCLPLNITNKMQRYTILFIAVDAVDVSGGFFAHHQEVKNCTHSTWYMSSLLAVTVSVGELAVLINNKEYCITLHLVGYT
jgi:hypothetical protein